jgi:rhodanese-related sulfurtransferase
MIIHLIKRILIVSFLVCFACSALAIDTSKVPKQKQTEAGLYFTSLEASEHMANNAASTLFIDIRDPVEIFILGMPLAVDRNITFKYIDPTQWNENNETFGMKVNPDFTQNVSEQLKAKGLSNTDTIILICGSGIRSASAASILEKAGYDKVYSVIDGYHGWQQSHLKWSRELDRTKVLVNECNRDL